MKKTSKVLSFLFITTLGLTSCGIGALPHDERYSKIDRVLSDIDYQNIGTIVHEEIDNGDGIFSSSYKKIYYEEDITFNKLFSKLKHAPQDVNEDCSNIILNPSQLGARKSISCTYYGNSITISRESNNEFNAKAVIMIIDTSNGR